LLKHYKIIITGCLVFFYSKVISYHFSFLKLLYKKKIVYSKNLGFGDCLNFFVHNHKKIKNNNFKIFAISKFDKSIANFFFNKKNILNFFFFIPNFIIYKLSGKINKNFFFPKSLLFDINKKKVLKYHRYLISKNLNKRIQYVSKNLLKFKNTKYILFFIKYYNDNINHITGSHSRQSNNFQKILKIINMILKNNYKIIILGNADDKSIPILKKIVKKNKINNTFFFCEISKKYSFVDQIFIHFFSQGSIGSDSGAFAISVYLKKKIIFFDAIKLLESSFLEKHKNIKFLYKRININNKNRILTSDYVLRKKPKIIENPFEEIKNEFQKTFLLSRQ
jgi:hypothetical protein